MAIAGAGDRWPLKVRGWLLCLVPTRKPQSEPPTPTGLAQGNAAQGSVE